jgi:hypothetical protein
MVRGHLAWIAIGCGSAPTPPERPAIAAGEQVDPKNDAPPPPPDAGLPDAVTTAPAWVFEYKTAERSELWTLRHADGLALLVVESATGPLRYTGTATDGTSLAIAVTTGTAKLALDCKREKLAVSAKCNDTKAKPSEVLNCYHPDFKAPMSFAPAPGIQYVVEPGCTGFRLRKP